MAGIRRSTRAKRSGSRSVSENDAVKLMVHGPEYNGGEHLVLNPETFPNIKVHDLLEISQLDREHPRLVLQVTSMAPVRGKLQVSVLRDIAAQFGLEAFRDVTVQKVDPQDITVDFMELSFKDQFLSRADIWRFKVNMLGQCVHVGKTVECLGMRSQVDALLVESLQLECGVIGEATKIVVRSRSSRLFWLVQMSAEMWEFAPDGELYYEKLLNRLLRTLIAKWIDCSVSHSVTIIAFSRSFYDANQFPKDFDPKRAPFVEPRRQGFGPGCTAPGVNMASGYGPTIHVDPLSGRYYEDFYKVLVSNYTGPDWGHLLSLLKKEFASYPETHRWRTPDEPIPAEYRLCYCPKEISVESQPQHAEVDPICLPALGNQMTGTLSDDEVYVQWTKLPFGVPSRAMDGNMLESINVTLNVLDKAYTDRDLNHTGQSIVMMTAGCSIFNVRSELAEITKQRMMDNGVGIELVSLTTPPLHTVPLFLYRTSVNETVDDSQSSPPQASYRVPLWMHSTFLDFDCKCDTSVGAVYDQRPLAVNTAHPTVIHPHHLCQCQYAMNQKFLPLPRSRIADLSTSSEGASFPIALRKVLRQSLPKRQTPVETSSTASAEPSEQSFPAFVPSVAQQWELSRPYDLELNLPPHPKRFSGSLSSSLIAREALEEYDTGVFCLGPAAITLANSPADNTDNNNVCSATIGCDKSPAEDALVARQKMTNQQKQAKKMSLSRGDQANRRNSMFDARVSMSSKTPLNPRQPYSMTPTHDTNQLSVFSAVAPFIPTESFTPAKVKDTTHRSCDESAPWPTRTAQGTLSALAPSLNVVSSTSLQIKDMTSRPRKCDDVRVAMSSVHDGIDDPGYASILGKSVDSSVLYAEQLGRNPKDGSAAGTIVKSCAFVSNAKTYGMDCPSANGTLLYDSLFPTLQRATTMRNVDGTSSEHQSQRSTTRSVAISISSGGHPWSRSGKEIFGRRSPERPSVASDDAGGSADWSPCDGLTDASDGPFINPFRYPAVSTDLSGERRRWRHLFPVIHPENGHEDTGPLLLGPNWKNLITPPILPMTTDYFPSPKDLRTHFTESFYGLALPSTTSDAIPKYNSHNDLLTEMICQRLASDFQLVVSSVVANHESSGRSSRPSFVRNIRCTNASTMGSGEPLKRGAVYFLSMGHRIHQLIYDCERQTIEVKRYLQRRSKTIDNSFTYMYSLWEETTKSFCPLQQHFHQYQQPEENWNALDQLLCGYNDEMADSTKCRRIRFVIVPPEPDVTTDQGMNETLKEPGKEPVLSYSARFAKFVEYIQSRAAPPQDGEPTVQMVEVVTSERLEAQKRTPRHVGGRSMLKFKICCKAATPVGSAADGEGSLTSQKPEDLRTEWVVVYLEDRMDLSRSYHLDVRWLACSGIVADEFVGTLKRKTKQCGLQLRRIPEYVCVPYLHMHPLVTPLFIPVPNYAMKTPQGEDASHIEVMMERLGFILDSERVTGSDGIGYGLGIEKESKIFHRQRASISGTITTSSVRALRRPRSSETLIGVDKWRTRGYSQFLHRRLPVILRIISNGVVWVPYDEYDEKVDRSSIDGLLHELYNSIQTNADIATKHSKPPTPAVDAKR